MKIIHQIKKLFSRRYRKENALRAIDHRMGEWLKVSTRGWGYIPSHKSYVYDEINAIRKDMERIL